MITAAGALAGAVAAAAHVTPHVVDWPMDMFANAAALASHAVSGPLSAATGRTMVKLDGTTDPEDSDY